MSTAILQKLEDRVDNAVETIELLRLQIEEFDEKVARLQNENASLKNKQVAWEQNLTIMLEKLDSVESKASVKVREEEAMPA